MTPVAQLSTGEFGPTGEGAVKRQSCAATLLAKAPAAVPSKQVPMPVVPWAVQVQPLMKTYPVPVATANGVAHAPARLWNRPLRTVTSAVAVRMPGPYAPPLTMEKLARYAVARWVVWRRRDILVPASPAVSARYPKSMPLVVRPGALRVESIAKSCM